MQASLSGADSAGQPDQETTVIEAYQFLIDAAIILYFIPFLYMFAAVIKLANRRIASKILMPFWFRAERPASWICGGLGFAVVLLGIIVSSVPPGESANKLGFEMKLVGGTVVSILLGLILYWRGARSKTCDMMLSCPTCRCDRLDAGTIQGAIVCKFV